MAESSNAPCDRGAGFGRPANLRLELKRGVADPALARAAVAAHCRELAISGSVCRTLALLVSEVVSNAVLHSGGAPEAPIVLTATITDTTVGIAVADAGGRGFAPRARDTKGAGGGYGLYMLETRASRWGVEPDGGTRVWFELPRAVPPG
jgi:anti-sigma regulatory factor (Ser/Thr protein kinase)